MSGWYFDWVSWCGQSKVNFWTFWCSAFLTTTAITTTVVYFNQLLSAARTQKLIKIFFFSRLKKTFLLFIFRHFLLISGVKSMKNVWNKQKRLKTAEKRYSTSCWVCAAPESWSKYTTNNNNARQKFSNNVNRKNRNSTS